MKSKTIKYSALFIGLFFLLSSLVAACGQPALSLASPPPPALPPPATANSTESQPPEQLPPVDEATDGEEWNMVETFTGEGNETTPPFHVSGTKWRITWTIDAECPENAVFNLVIYCKDTPYAIWQTFSYSGGSGSDVTYYIPYDGGNRDFFIKVLARRLRNWTITVEDDAADTSLSPVKITDIHYRGTFYPKDPESLICFERNEPDEYVVIKNLGDCRQDMSGWVLKNITKGFPSFTFPPGFLLFPGQIIWVYTNKTNLEYPELGGLLYLYDLDDITTTSYCQGFTKLWFTFYYRPGDIWNNEEPNVAALYNAKGEEVSRRSYAVPSQNGAP